MGGVFGSSDSFVGVRYKEVFRCNFVFRDGALLDIYGRGMRRMREGIVPCPAIFCVV
jgi:hypothetical protein